MQENVLKLWCSTLKGETLSRKLHVSHFITMIMVNVSHILCCLLIVSWNKSSKRLGFCWLKVGIRIIVHWPLSWWWNETHVASAKVPPFDVLHRNCTLTSQCRWNIVSDKPHWNYSILMRYRKEMQFHLLPEMYNKMSNPGCQTKEM